MKIDVNTHKGHFRTSTLQLRDTQATKYFMNREEILLLINNLENALSFNATDGAISGFHCQSAVVL